MPRFFRRLAEGVFDEEDVKVRANELADFVTEARDAGICLSGGGALLSGLVERLVAETGMAVRRADDPLGAVITGAQRIAAGEAAVSCWS